MCGIVGFTYSNKHLISQMTKALNWRGPDASAFYVSNGISLGHTRLSIIDLNMRSNQPMTSGCGRYQITYNGEIYNYLILKSKYLNDYLFKTDSETEVILELFCRFGPNCFSLLSGMFAIAIWDNVRSELFIARDRYGIKPLYYSLDRSILYFCSSPNVIADINGKKVLNLNALSTYARFGYSFGEESFFKGVNCFPAGKYAVYSSKKLNFFDFNSYEVSLTDLSLYDIHSQEIKKHLVSDCGVGVFLSGGIDSSIVAYHSAKYIQNLNTYTCTFSGKKIKSKFNNDGVRAREVSAFLNTNHQEVNIDTSEVPDLLSLAVEAMTSPISNPTAVALYKLSGYANQTSKVILSGDGNDELFLGYDRYIKVRKLSFFLENSMSKGLVNFRHKKNVIDKYFDLFYRFHGNKDENLYPFIKYNWIDSNYTANTLSKFYKSGSDKIKLQTFIKMDRDLWLQNFSFLLSDNMTMKHSVELRIPFMSDEIVYFADHIPMNKKISRSTGKIYLRQIYKKYLPNCIFEPKNGFMSPASEWLRSKKVKSLFSDTLLTKNNIFDSLYNKDNIFKAYEKHISMEKYYLNELWSTFVFKKWLDFNKFSDISY